MTSHVIRLYVLVGAVCVFFVTWAVVAAHPWQAHRITAADRQLTALTALRSRLRVESLEVQRILDRRFAAYAGALVERKREIALLNSLQARRAAPLGTAAPVAAPVAASGAALPPAAPVVVAAPAVSTTHTS